MTPQDLIAAFDEVAEAPDGVTRLRELVLQLAVRGKLVSQDPTDEPARALLNRIDEEKMRLVKEGKVRKPKPLRPVSEDEAPFDVPEGWAFAHLAETFIPISTSGHKVKSRDVLESGAFPVVDQGQSDIAGYTNHGDKLISPVEACVVFGDHTRAIKFVDFPFVAGADGVKILQPILASPRYFYTALRGFNLSARGYGRHYKILLEQLISLPPLAEQHRIVAKVDELMGLLDRLEAARNARETTRTALRDAALAVLRDADTPEVVEAAWARIADRMDDLFTDPADVGPLRRTVLQLAVRGRLAPQDPTDEPASVLLERIDKEKARLIAEGRIRRPKPLPPISRNETPFETPNGWSWCRLQDIGDWGAGATPRRGDARYYGGSINWFKSGELPDGPMHGPSAEQVTQTALDECSLRENLPGDVLIAMYGATIGKLGLLQVSGTTNQAVCACTCHEGFYNRFLFLFLEAWRQSFIGRGEGGAQPNISKVKIVFTVAPVPPLAEQHRIVAKVNELMGLLHHLEQRLTVKTTAHDAFAAAAVHHLDT